MTSSTGREAGSGEAGRRPALHASLTSTIKNHSTPLARHLADRFPNTRALARDYAQRVGVFQVSGGRGNPGTIGAAFDYMVRFSLDPMYAATLASMAFRRPETRRTVQEVAATASACARMGTPVADRLFACAAWSLALCTEMLRAPDLLLGSPLALLMAEDRFTAREMLGLADPGAQQELVELLQLARERLLPQLAGRQPLALGPTFKASKLCSADADLICDGLLLDLKTKLGRVTPSGSRFDGLAATETYQLVGYTLFDTDDEFHINRIGLYSARYGSLVDWPLDEALSTLAGRPVDVAEERRLVWDLLEQWAGA